jgi:hypothetical protein
MLLCRIGSANGSLVEAVDDLADDVGALVAVEQRRQHLDLEVGPQLDLVQAAGDGLEHVARVALQIVEGLLQRKLSTMRTRVSCSVSRVGIVGAVGGRGRRLVFSMYSVLTAGRTKMKSLWK